MMKLKPGFSLRSVLDMYVVIGKGKEAYIPRTILSTNDTGAFLWNILQEGAEPAELVRRLTEEYDVDAETAQKDVEVFLGQLREKALIEAC